MCQKIVLFILMFANSCVPSYAKSKVPLPKKSVQQYYNFTSQELWESSYLLRKYEKLKLHRDNIKQGPLCYQESDRDIIPANVTDVKEPYCKSLVLNKQRLVAKEMQIWFRGISKKELLLMLPVVSSLCYQIGLTGFTWTPGYVVLKTIFVKHRNFSGLKSYEIKEIQDGINNSFSTKIYDNIEKNKKWIEKNQEGWVKRRMMEGNELANILLEIS